ncbi:MAG TPA: cupin domain-containing protein [Dermatophilaceae bacterium]|nr:cupin domain-containing protein [Dermatophilaceae bacterium]
MTRRRVVTADDVLRAARSGATELVVAPADRVTPLARDVAHERRVALVADGAQTVGRNGRRAAPSVPPPPPPSRLVHVAGAGTVGLEPFPFPGPAPEMDVRTHDVVTGADGFPMAAGVMSLREGSFPWTLDYDEVEYVLEGELHVTRGSQRVVGRPGDVIAVPRGSSITFGTPSWTRFLYVTHPADWAGPR